MQLQFKTSPTGVVNMRVAVGIHSDDMYKSLTYIKKTIVHRSRMLVPDILDGICTNHRVRNRKDRLAQAGTENLGNQMYLFHYMVHVE
jgi:hypothetical protein